MHQTERLQTKRVYQTKRGAAMGEMGCYWRYNERWVNTML
jgi:hypothetical protein